MICINHFIDIYWGRIKSLFHNSHYKGLLLRQIDTYNKSNMKKYYIVFA